MATARKSLLLRWLGVLLTALASLWAVSALFMAAIVWLNCAEPDTGTPCVKTFDYYRWLYQPLLAVPGAIAGGFVASRLAAGPIRRLPDLGAALPAAVWLAGAWGLSCFVL